MSKKKCKKNYFEAAQYTVIGYDMNYRRNCICDFRWLIILILVVLQFGGKRTKDGVYDIDNSILFIIALYFLTCGNLC